MQPERAARGGLLGNRDYLLLFSAQVTSLLGSGVTSVALAVFAYQLAGRDATLIVGTALMLRILAFVLLSPVAGVLADRLNRKRILISADLLRCALLGLFPFVTEVWEVYVLIFAINAVTAFFTPTYEATLPEVVGPALYARALSASRIAIDVEGALGPLVAGLLIVAVGVQWTFWFDAATYLVSAVLVWQARLPAQARPSAAAPTKKFGSELTYGTRILLREPALRQALVLHMAEAVAGAATIVATVVYVHDVLGRGDGSFALAMAAAGAGSTVTALWLARTDTRARTGAAGDPHQALHGRARRTLLVGGVLSAAALLPGVLMPGLLLLLVLWTINGAGGAMIAIPSVALLADHTAPEERGRAYAAHFAWTHLFWLATYPAVGYLSKSLGTPLTFTAAGALCAVITLVAWSMPSAHRPHSNLVTNQ